MRHAAVASCLLMALAATAQALPLPLAAPIVDFHWSPAAPLARYQVTFVSTSMDPDGAIVLYEWTIADDEPRLTLDDAAEASFARRGVYAATLRAMDVTGLWGAATKHVVVENTPPVPSFHLPQVAYRGQPVALFGIASDVDGDAIVSWTWQLGDGSVAHGPNATHVYTALGRYEVALTVRDEAGAESSLVRALRVLNRPPEIVAQMHPAQPRVGERVTFAAEGVDPDLPGGAVAFRWDFSDGYVYAGDTLERNFSRAGDFSVAVRGTDSEGAVSQPVVLAFRVEAASGGS